MPAITYAGFKNTVTLAVERYLQVIAACIRQCQLRAAPRSVHLFPSTLLFTKTETHYVFELLGSRRQHGPLLVKENTKIASFNRLVGSFDSNADTMYLFGSGTSEQANVYLRFENMTLTSQLHMEQLETRFPGFATLSPKSQLRSFLSSTSFMPIDAQSVRTLALNQCYLTSNLGTIIRPRYINFLFGESKDADVQEFTNDFGRHTNIPSAQLMGVRAVSEGHLESLLLAAEFSSLYLQDVEETTLTQFLSNHAEAIKRAFTADSIYLEQTLPWIDGDHDDDEINIRPDVIVRRADGNWLIIDFKLPLLGKKVTTGKRARRKFVYTVNDGISQLFRYAEYFGSPGNQEAAAEILGEVVSSPQLTLVVGSFENVNMAEVDQAKRSYKQIDIVDYDTLIRLFLADRHGHEHAY